MAKKLTSTKARKILHDKEVHGKPLTEKQRKFFGAIAGGAEPYKAQIGTMLTSLPSNYMETLSEALGFPQKAVTKMVTGKYQTPSEAMNIRNPVGAFATDAVLDPLNLLGGAGFAKAAGALDNLYKINPIARKTPAFSSLPRAGEMIRHPFQNKMVPIEEVSGNVERFYPKNVEAGGPGYSAARGSKEWKELSESGRFDLMGKEKGTHAMIDLVTDVEKRKLAIPTSDLAKYRLETNVQGVPNWLMGYPKAPKKQDGGWLDKYDEGGVLKQKKEDNYGVQGNYNNYDISLPDGFKGWAYNLKGRNYSPAWGGQFQMGGSLPGATGFMYARTINPAPSNGPYAKKTKASAQNGQEMKYYQAGLDFKPKTISQDGSDIPVDPMGYWNPENVGEPVIIPSNIITMEGVDQPLLGISDTGDVQYMEPGEDYEFDGEYVTEYPMAQKGKRVPIVVSDPRDRRLTRYNDSLALYNNYVQNKNLIESALRPQFKKMGYEDIYKYTRPYSRDRNFFELPDGSSTVRSYGKNERVTAPQYKTDTDAVNRRKIIRHKIGNITVPEYEQLWSTSIAPVRTTLYNPGESFYSTNKNFTGDIYSIDKTELVPYGIRRLEDSPEKRKMLKERAEFVKKWPYTIHPSKSNYSFDLDEYAKPVQPVEYRKPETKAPAPEPVRQTATSPVVTAPSFTPPIVPSGSVGVFGPGRSRIGEYDEKTNTFYPDYGNLAARNKANQADADLISDEKELAAYVASKTGKKPKIDVTLAKQRNGGVNNADAQPLKKLDQLFNFTNYNKPTKGGWLDKYN